MNDYSDLFVTVILNVVEIILVLADRKRKCVLLFSYGAK